MKHWLKLEIITWKFVCSANNGSGKNKITTRVVFHIATPRILAYPLQSLPPMLHKLQPDSMSSCSKAPRGLFVLVRTDGIFTANALSPSPSLRQCPHRYTIRAGQNLPDKEFRYLRTVIVTAAVHRGFSSLREQISLTFRHRAGVSPYTSTFVLAQTCVFGKQSRGLFSCGPVTLSITRCVSEASASDFLNDTLSSTLTRLQEIYKLASFFNFKKKTDNFTPKSQW